jgi:hypothetical protein
MPSSGDEFRNADQVVSDQIEQKVPGDAADAAMPGPLASAVIWACLLGYGGKKEPGNVLG